MTLPAMQAPALYDVVPTIFVVTPLADALGAVEDGLIEYHYVDAVKLAGHSCLTVAGAWLMTLVRAMIVQRVDRTFLGVKQTQAASLR